MQLLLLALSATLVAADQGGVPTASSWIWYPESPATEGAGQWRSLRRVVNLANAPEAATLRVRSDDSHRVRVNGKPVPAPRPSGIGGEVHDLAGVLTKGENVLAFEVFNSGGPGGLIVTGTIREVGGVEQQIHSDASFRASKEPVEGWDRPGFDDTAWPAAVIVGSAFAAPWYRHPAFDLEPFLEPADRARWAAWRDPLVALPKGLVQERAARARFEYVNGSCALVLNGKPRPPMIYRGTVDPLSAHGRRQLGLFRDAGVHVYTAYLPLSACWNAPESFNFDVLDDVVRAYLSADPQGYLFLILRLVPPTWWMDAHEAELVRYAAGDDFNTSDESGRVRRASFASKLWQRDALQVWRAAIEHLEKQPWGKRVIGYQPGYGIYTEWHYFGSWMQQMPDTGAAMTAHFRDWLRKRYSSVGQLRKAWANPEVTFETATVPGVEPRLAAGPLGLRDPADGQWVMDYYRCQQEVTANDIELFCAAAKALTKGRVLCGAFYGYFNGVPPQTQGGHLELERLLKSPSVDYFAAPYDYSHRLMGDDGRGRAIVDAFPLAGKVHMVEVDTRTHLHPVNEYGKLATTEESVAAIRREVATALVHGSALWWCDFGADGSGGWYDDPALIGEVARLVKLAEKRLTAPRKRVAEVAVICDLQSCYSLGDGEAMRTHLRLTDEVGTQLYRTGTPFDTLLRSQLGLSDLSRYRLLVFLNTLRVDEPTRKVVVKATNGRSVLWLWAPGITDGNGFGPELVEKLTGFRVALRDRGLPAAVVTCTERNPLTDRLPVTPRWELVPETTTPIAAALQRDNWYNPRDAKTMAEAYTRFEWTVADGTVRWAFGTTHGWTDIRLNATVEECDGISLTVSGEGSGEGLGLRVVVKGADGGEFVAPSFGVVGEPRTHLLPFTAFAKASWDRSDATKIAFPLKGAKLVLDGTGGGRLGALVVRDLSAVRGKTVKQETRAYGDPAHPCPALVLDDPEAAPLGHDENTGAVLLACKGEPGRRRVFSTVPFVPHQLLEALMDDAGVCRYVDSPDVIVRADSELVSLHTAVGGKYELRLPHAATVRDALTGERLGRGPKREVTLPPSSTTLLSVGPSD